MTVTLIVLLLVLAVVLAKLTKPRDGSRRRFPKPGEGMRRRDVPNAPVGAPAGLVAVRRGVPPEEAHVLAGLLESSGIRASLNAARGGFVGKGPASSLDVLVAADQADEARELLRG